MIKKAQTLAGFKVGEQVTWEFLHDKTFTIVELWEGPDTAILKNEDSTLFTSPEEIKRVN